MLFNVTDNPKDCPFPFGICTLSNTWFLGPTWLILPNSISVSLAIVTNMQIHRRPRYSICSNRPLSLTITATQPKSKPVITDCGI